MAKDLEILCFGCGFDGGGREGGGDIFPFNPFLYLYLVYILSFNFLCTPELVRKFVCVVGV
jgi:hypothetical protein